MSSPRVSIASVPVPFSIGGDQSESGASELATVLVLASQPREFHAAPFPLLDSNRAGECVAGTGCRSPLWCERLVDSYPHGRIGSGPTLIARIRSGRTPFLRGAKCRALSHKVQRVILSSTFDDSYMPLSW